MAGQLLLHPEKTSIVIVSNNRVAKRQCNETHEPLLRIAAVIDKPILQCDFGDPGGDPLEKLMTILGENGNHCVVIAGQMLETGVTRTALTLLSEGFDPFICKDLCTTADPENRDVYLERLSQAMCTISTLRQICLELAMAEQNTHRRSELRNYANTGLSLSR